MFSLQSKILVYKKYSLQGTIAYPTFGERKIIDSKVPTGIGYVNSYKKGPPLVVR